MSDPGVIGIVGLGAMGSEIGRHLIASGRQVLGFDRDPGALARFSGIGGEAAAAVADLGKAGVVLNCVFDDKAVRETSFGEGGLAASMKPGSIHVVTATVSPDLARELGAVHAEKGQFYLSAPVFGRPEAAAAAALSINCSGPFAAYSDIKALLGLLGRSRWIGEDPAQAMILKLMGNNMIYAAAGMVREMYTLLRAAGIKDVDASELVVDTLFPCPIYAGYAQRFAQESGPGQPNPIAAKDNRMCFETAQALGVELPIVELLYGQLNRPIGAQNAAQESPSAASQGQMSTMAR